MYAEERQEEILRVARAQGRVDVTALADDFRVTAETIRRDLTVLERAGVLRRVHGGAIPVERIGFEPALAARDSVLITEKERIAKAALAELPDEGAVILDAGSTTARLAQALPADRELFVVVNSPVLATVLGTRANLTVLLLGGRVRGKTLATVDDWALRPLADMYVDVAFMGTNGCSVERGLTTPDPAEATVKRAMIAAARRVVLLADHTKIGNDYLARFGALDDLDVLITDTGVDAELAGDVEAAGVRVVRA
ncbi:DeoR family transcriptional regulator [Asanoa ferruginea]|uniref:Lactose phosphotransferase system repressor n=1 Tax=Asanoa ferruginea TaxID=53367 RepID=A0A3D9ZXL9_9ACTN|nr:DeoR/GlpR family DNA-binding transcription regulator [Asanoa ferruginea]REG01958.1 DeoR family transcriptional regulator [Asanoa ferruginea]GIF49933.1 DeoR family transcriptional regulator [Asanoa ferruginea]